MKKVCILQKYLMPYRVPLFKAISDHPRIDLTVMYYGTKETRRKATIYPERNFNIKQTRVLSFKGTYEHNYDFPVSLYHDLKSLKPDVIICAPDFGGLAALGYAKNHGAKYIIWSEGTPLTESRRSCLKLPLRKLIYSQAWRFLVPGQQAEEYIRSFVPQGHIFSANNAIQNEAQFRISEKELLEKFSQDNYQVIFSGSFIKRKGINLLLDAFKNLLTNKPALREKYSLKILGAGPMELGGYRDENIVFAGFCEGKDYIDHMKSSNIFVLPSLHDCNPLTVIEALFTGNIVIVSDAVGSHPEAVQGNGLVIPTGSAEAIYKALLLMSSLSPEELKILAQRSVALSENFTTKRSAAGFLAAILS